MAKFSKCLASRCCQLLILRCLCRCCFSLRCRRLQCINRWTSWGFRLCFATASRCSHRLWLGISIRADLYASLLCFCCIIKASKCKVVCLVEVATVVALRWLRMAVGTLHAFLLSKWWLRVGGACEQTKRGHCEQCTSCH